MCCPLQLLSQETIREVKIDLPDEISEASAKSSKEKLLDLFKEKVLQESTESLKSLNESALEDFFTENDCKILNELINRGIFSDIATSRLFRNGLSKKSIVKAMKYGLAGLRFDEIHYFYIFNITPENIMHKDVLLCNIDKELIAKLTCIGFSDLDSLNIILSGLIKQNDCFLFQLSANGISAFNILKWQGERLLPSQRKKEFLKNLGVDDSILNIIKKKGISEEAQEILNKLGYDETVEDKFSLFKNESLLGNYIAEESTICKCHSENMDFLCEMPYDREEEEEEEKESFIQSSSIGVSKSTDTDIREIKAKKDYLRKNLMVPLTWALDTTLKYKPTNPIYYMACQLYRWKYNNVNPAEVDYTLNFVIDATTKRDENLLEKASKEETKSVSSSGRRMAFSNNN